MPRPLFPSDPKEREIQMRQKFEYKVYLKNIYNNITIISQFSTLENWNEKLWCGDGQSETPFQHHILSFLKSFLHKQWADVVFPEVGDHHPDRMKSEDGTASIWDNGLFRGANLVVVVPFWIWVASLQSLVYEGSEVKSLMRFVGIENVDVSEKKYKKN